MHEREVKILDVDPDALQAKLVALGAHLVNQGPVEAQYFERSTGRKLSKDRSSLRLRLNGVLELTLKHRKRREGGVKVCDESTVVLRSEDTAAMNVILEALGAGCIRTETKHRISYALRHEGEDVHFDIDDLGDDIPPLIEIEATRDALIWHFVEVLGFKRSDAVDWTTTEVRKYYEKRKKKPKKENDSGARKGH